MATTKLLEVSITTVNSCTRRCPYCYYSTPLALSRPTKRMSLFIFKKIINDLQKIDYDQLISPFEGNEPLLDLRLPHLVNIISQNLPRAKSFIFTNGDLLNFPICQNLFFFGLNKIFVSLHDQKNKNKINRLVKAFGESRIGIFPMYLHHPPDYHNFAGIIKNKLVSQKLFPFSNCDLPFRQLVIDVNGNVNLCCVDIADRITFANARYHSVVDIFYHHPLLNLIRRQLNQNQRRLPICQHCSYPGNSPITKF